MSVKKGVHNHRYLAFITIYRQCMINRKPHSYVEELIVSNLVVCGDSYHNRAMRPHKQTRSDKISCSTHWCSFIIISTFIIVVLLQLTLHVQSLWRWEEMIIIGGNEVCIALTCNRIAVCWADYITADTSHLSPTIAWSKLFDSIFFKSVLYFLFYFFHFCNSNQ